MLRTILLIVGVLIILGIAFDGWRRKRKRLQQTQLAGELQQRSVANEAVSVSGIVDNAAQKTEVVNIEPIQSAEIDITEELIVQRAELELAEQNAENILLLKEKFTAPVASGPIPVEIEPLEEVEPSANQKLPEKPVIKSENIQSANQRMPKKVPEDPVEKEKISEVLTLAVMAINSRPFAGYDVIHALQECHLHHGEFDIYHRYKYRNGKGPLCFSVASVIKPGTINPRKVGELSTPGLVLFMELDNPKHDRTVFKQVLATAHELAKTLGGVVCDNNRVPLREGTLQSYADKINL